MFKYFNVGLTRLPSDVWIITPAIVLSPKNGIGLLWLGWVAKLSWDESGDT